jgi:dTDP-L-rhamnose 4-epimerase
VAVSDVVRACRLVLERDGADGLPVNIGTGRDVSILEVADQLATTLGRDVRPEITGAHRAGDIRHCFADVTRARELLRYEPLVPLRAGIAELATWLESQVADDRADEAMAALAARGLAR